MSVPLPLILPFTPFISSPIFLSHFLIVFLYNPPPTAHYPYPYPQAIKKLKASVDEGGRELQKVLEWNEKYGEVKRKGKSKGGTHMSLYI